MSFRRQNSLDSDIPNSGPTRRNGGNGGLAGETRRFGKRGMRVKHEATVLTLVSPAAEEVPEPTTTVQEDGVLCTKL